MTTSEQIEQHDDNEAQASPVAVEIENEEEKSPEKKRSAPEAWVENDTESTIANKEVEEEVIESSETEKEEQNNDHQTTLPSAVIPQRPVKKARTAYFIFAEEKRPELAKQNAGAGVTGMAKLIGQLWSTLSADEKKIYQDKATAEREQVAQDLKAWKAAGGVVDEPVAAEKSDPNVLTFPAARIRKICKLDPDVKNLSKEALLLVCKAAELALSQLGRESVKVAQIQNRRKLIPDDVAQVCATREPFLFLREDIQDLARAAQQAQPKAVSKNAKAGAKGYGRPITDFFAPKSSL